MGDFDGVDSGVVEGQHDAFHVVGSDPVTHRVHPVTQRDVLDVDGGAHATAPLWAAMRSATWMAADVMMSRLPAYAGR